MAVSLKSSAEVEDKIGDQANIFLHVIYNYNTTCGWPALTKQNHVPPALHYMFLFSLMQILYFVGLLVVNLLTCLHSQGMFHHCPMFGITAQELVTNELRVFWTSTQDCMH